ncbi:ankyrin repeat-containing domain protein [Pelagophyceae sp. CCMP2097]|nr:ankyrin repeat-containing domain protein [Pelagophyceae sp. CCMP2097]
MGAASSTAGGELEELVACTYLLGQALASMSFPDMYRIHDFHSRAAPPLKTPLDALDALDLGYRFQSDESAGSATPRSSQASIVQPVLAEPFDYFTHFNVMVAGERIVIDDVARQNGDGWTALHACCHSHASVGAALALVEELQRIGATLELRTKRGPGAYNARWTALHMACAYGIEPVVAALLDAGADACCRNSLGWTPLHEACHRGFTTIVKGLLAHIPAAELAHVPDAEAAQSHFPFARPPPQSALGEAARCGFKEIVTLLLEAGAPKDAANSIGWTPLHEATFYNHVDATRALLVYGVDATKRDVQGATAFHVSSVPQIRQVLRDLGGPDAARPRDSQLAVSKNVEERRLAAAAQAAATTAPQVAESKDADERPPNASQTARAAPFLHRGEKLGDLPSLSPASRGGAKPADGGARQKSPTNWTPSKRRGADAPSDIPADFLCEISQRLLSDPYRTPYGNVYESKVIRAWFAKNGSICPLTGQPLVVSELTADVDLKARIDAWNLQKSMTSMQAVNAPTSPMNAVLTPHTAPRTLAPRPAVAPPTPAALAAKLNGPDDEDLYDF